MNSFILLYLFLINAIVSLVSAEAFPLKIISPSSNSSLQFGALVNITVEIPEGTSNRTVLGFSLNLNSTDLNGTFLGLMNTTQKPSSEKTRQLSGGFQIPSKESFHSKSTSYILVAWYYTFSGASHSNVSTLASVPITLIDRYNSTSQKHSANTTSNHSTAGVDAEIIELTKDKLNASLHAKGHNTGDTIPDIPGSEESVANNSYSAITNTLSTPASVTNLTAEKNRAKPPVNSGDNGIGISVVLCAITALIIYSATF